MQEHKQSVRETYEEYELSGGTAVGMISDPENEYAWIQSDTVIELGIE